MSWAVLHELAFWFVAAFLAGAALAFLWPSRRWLIATAALATGLFWVVLGGSAAERLVYATVLFWYFGGWSLGVLFGSGWRRRRHKPG